MNNVKTALQHHKEAFFDVVERPVSVDNRILASKKAIVRADTGDVLSVMSRHYVPVSNKKTLESFAEIAEEAKIEWTLTAAHTIQNGTKTIMEMTFPNNSVNAGKINKNQDDILEMKGYLTNGFDGFNAAKLEIGFVRLICKNGMVGYQTDKVMRQVHMGAVNEKLVEAFRNGINDVVKASADFVKKLTETKFKNKETVQAIISSSKWVGQKYQEELVNEWKVKKQALNAWILYNVYTYVITHLMKVNMSTRLQHLSKLNRETQSWPQ